MMIYDAEVQKIKKDWPGCPAAGNVFHGYRGKSADFCRPRDVGGVAQTKATMGTATKRKNFARFVEEQCVTSSACDLPDFARNKPSYSDGNTHTVQL